MELPGSESDVESMSRRWIVFIASCMVGFMDFALVLAFGSMFIPLLERFGQNRTTTATVQSILMGTANITSVISGTLIRRFGVAGPSFLGSVLLSGGFICSYFANSILVLDVLIGVFGGIGVSLLYISSSAVARSTFTGSAGKVAVGTHITFTGLGSVVYPYFFEELGNIYDVKETFLIVGGLLLNNFIVALLFFFHEQTVCRSSNSQARVQNTHIEKKANSDNQKLSVSFTIGGLWQKITTFMQIRLVLVLIGTALTMSSNNGYVIVFNDIYLWKRYTEENTLICFTVFHALNAASRVLPVVISKLWPRFDLMLLLTMCAVTGVGGQFCVLLTSQFGWAIVANICIGIAQGCVISAGSIVIAAMVQTKESFAILFGLLFTLLGILSLSIGVIYGFIRDRVQSYEIATTLTIVLNGIGACLFLTEPVYRRWRRDGQNWRVHVTGESQPSPDNVSQASQPFDSGGFGVLNVTEGTVPAGIPNDVFKPPFKP